ncbi:MAG: signal peptidase I [Lachnospiraceae bacterium]|nr:signal peptidase I [Lachnospiraceae bacterium]
MIDLNISDSQKKNLVEVLKTIFVCLLIFTIFMIVKVFWLQVVSVKGDSMKPAIEDGNVLLINKLGNKDKYDRYDVIVFKPYSQDDPDTENEDESKLLYIKRVIGLPGETVTILEDGSIRVTDKNGTSTVLEDSYGSGYLSKGINWDISDDNIHETITLDSDEYFVLGDNRNISLDSRSSEIQAVHSNSIVGKYMLRIYPMF